MAGFSPPPMTQYISSQYALNGEFTVSSKLSALEFQKAILIL